MADPPPKEWLTVEQVAEELQVGAETVRRWIRSGDLAVLDVGGRRGGYRIKRTDLEKFIQGRYGVIGRWMPPIPDSN